MATVQPYFPILSFDQQHPFLTAMQRGFEMANQYEDAKQKDIQNKVLPDTLAEQLQQLKYKTQEDAVTAQYADPMAQAKLAQDQALPGLTKAQTQNLLADAGKTGMETQELQAKLPSILATSQLLARNPVLGLGLSGNGQDIALLAAMKQHPGDFGDAPNQQQGGAAQSPLASAMQPPIQPGSVDGYSYDAAPQGQGAPQGGALFDAIRQAAAQQQQGQPQNGSLTNNVAGSISPQGNGQQSLQDILMGRMNAQNARANYMNKMGQSLAWRSLPNTEKENEIAMAKGMGYTATEAGERLATGEKLQDLATEKGFSSDPDKWASQGVRAKFGDTTATITQQQTRNQGLAEMTSVDDQVNNMLAPYSDRINGISTKWLGDLKQINSGTDDKDTQAAKDRVSDYLGGNAFSTELQLIRARSINPGSKPGVQMLRDMKDTALQNAVKGYSQAIPQDVFIAANNKYDRLLRQSAEAANTSIQPYGSGGQQVATQNNAAPAVQNTQSSIPDANTWLAMAKQHNPNKSDKELLDYYNNKYGGKK